MTSDLIRMADVFGVSRELPRNYVTRQRIDGELIEALTRDKHIVIHGSSKQGKTSLRKYNLLDTDYIHVACQSTWTVSDLHSAILKRAGFAVERSSSVTVSGEHKINARLSAKIIGKIFGSGAEASVDTGGEVANSRSTTVSSDHLDLDPADPNDIISALEAINFDRFIVLEDFHYLSPETQANFAVALKAFHEDSRLVLIIVGVWLDSNRLVQHNGDLTGRVITVNADAWEPDELLEIIAAGERLLNVRFDSDFKAELVANCFESVWVVQESCYAACVRDKVLSEQPVAVVVGAGLDVRKVIAEVVASQSVRYEGFLLSFPGGFQSAPTELQMYKWLLLPVLSFSVSDLEKGLSFNQVKESINIHHPRAPLADNSFLQALQRTAALQVKQQTKPIVLDFDQTNRRLTIVDRGFLIWLQHQDRVALLDQIGLPSSSVRS